MSDNLAALVKKACRDAGSDRSRMMDIVRAVQDGAGCVSGKAMELIAKEVSVSRAEVESVVSFYAFLSQKPKGKIVIRLCNDIVDELQGLDAVAKALSDEAGIPFGATTADGKLTLEYAPCIGMSDQAPAALVNDVVVTRLTPEKAREIVRSLKKSADPAKLVKTLGDGNNAHKLVHAMVENNLRMSGPVVFDAFTPGSALKKAVSMTPVEVIRDMKTSRLRGRGGAGFPTGMKWEFTRQAPGDKRYVACNADEGEPGTFKDRVIMTEQPDLMFEGMTIAGYAIGAAEGIFYLRAEYQYLARFLESILARRRKEGLLGKNILGKSDFSFDIRIQLGAGAYICGEETSLLSSCEGFRGDPKTRPPFPAQKGYLGYPTTVNNVETFCCAARILDKGAGWFSDTGSKGSPGTKVLSIAGDCEKPGVYEVPFGTKVADLLKMSGARHTAAVQIGGPSGQMIGPADFQRTLCYDDLATGGSFLVFDKTRDVLHIAARFMEFFIEESCGYCTPCRAGNALILRELEAIAAGNADAADLADLKELCETVKTTSRCGLGQTSPNPVLSTMKNFASAYTSKLKPHKDGLRRSFSIRAALQDAETIAGRASEVFQEGK